jgi:two-component system response regulator NreC
MSLEKYSDLQAYLPKDHRMPQSFFAPDINNSLSCIYLISCLSNDRILYMEDTCREVTGYTPEKFVKKGMDFWFPLIHPDDMPAFTDKIIEAHRKIAEPGFKKEEGLSLVFEYRVRDPQDKWIRIRDTKYLLFPGNEVAIDMILCKFELIKQNAETSEVEGLLHSEKSCSKMLEFALVHHKDRHKQPIDDPIDPMRKLHPNTPAMLTRREREILRLIGNGLSTKMIADQCAISINTVETHRRHLKEKLNVRNSMELIKEASKVFWL